MDHSIYVNRILDELKIFFIFQMYLSRRCRFIQMFDVQFKLSACHIGNVQIFHEFLANTLLIKCVSNVLAIYIDKEFMTITFQDPLQQAIISFPYSLFLIFILILALSQRRLLSHHLMNSHLLFLWQAHKVIIGHSLWNFRRHHRIHSHRFLFLSLYLHHDIIWNRVYAQLLSPGELGHFRLFCMVAQTVGHEQCRYILLLDASCLDYLECFFYRVCS